MGMTIEAMPIRAISLLLWSGGFVAAPFSLRENGHECIDSSIHPQGNYSRAMLG
jgi:hypothetical protein